MIYQGGTDGGVKWSVTQTSGNTFSIQVGDKQREYTCQYPTAFGIDVSDMAAINNILDEMFDERGNQDGSEAAGSE